MRKGVDCRQLMVGSGLRGDAGGGLEVAAASGWQERPPEGEQMGKGAGKAVLRGLR